MISTHKFDVIKTMGQRITELGKSCSPMCLTICGVNFDRAPLSCNRTWRQEEAANETLKGLCDVQKPVGSSQE